MVLKSVTRSPPKSRIAAGGSRLSVSGCSREWPRMPSGRCAGRAGRRLLDDEPVAEAHQLLRELVGQDFDIDDDGVPRLHRGTASGRIISTVDTEMRHAQGSSQRFDGYKIHARSRRARCR